MAGARYAQHGTVFEIELTREGCALVERRFGADLSEDRRAFASEREAARAYHERTAELLETRWRRISACEALDDRAPNPGLAAAAASGDLEARAVYSDWLLEHGDACGELASLRVAEPTADVQARIAEVELEQGVELFGLMAVLGPAWWAQFELEWRGGWIEQVTARHRFMTDGRAMTAAEAREALHHLLHAPMARFVHHLALDADFVAAAQDTLASCPHIGGIAELTLLAPTRVIQDLDEVLPSLRRLNLVGGLGSRGHPRVESIVIVIRTDALAWLPGHWPALRRVEVRIESGDPYVQSSIAQLVRGPSLCGATHLAFVAARHLQATLIDALLESRLWDTLTHLRIAAPLRPKILGRLEAAVARRPGFVLELA